MEGVELGSVWDPRGDLITKLNLRTFSTKVRPIACWPASCEGVREIVIYGLRVREMDLVESLTLM